MKPKEVQSPWLFQPEVQQRSNRSPLLLQQREPRRDQQRQVRHSVRTSFGHQLYRNWRFGDKIQNNISSHCFALEWSRKLIFYKDRTECIGSAWCDGNIFTTKIHREVRSIRITSWIRSWLGDRLGLWRTKHRWNVLKRSWMKRIRTWLQEAHLVIHFRFYRDWTKEQWAQRNSKQD